MTTVSSLAPGMPNLQSISLSAFGFFLLLVGGWEAAHTCTKILIIFHVFSYRYTQDLFSAEIQRDVLHKTRGGFLIPSQ